MPIFIDLILTFIQLIWYIILFSYAAIYIIIHIFFT